MKTLKKCICMVLSLLMFIEIIQINVLASSVETIMQESISESAALQESKASQAEILGEDIELRTANSKSYRMSDGSYTVAMYRNNVHYQSNGEWKEVDNSLTAVREGVLSTVSSYETGNTDKPVSMPNEFGTDDWITAGNGKYTVKMRPLSSFSAKKNKSSAQISAQKRNAVEAEEIYSELKNSKISSHVEYNNVFGTTDLQYNIVYGEVKESIVVESRADKYEYSFEMDFGGLTPIVEADGSVGLYEAKTKLMQLDAMYMFDSNGEVSEAVTYSIKSNGNTCIVTVTADEQWINDEARAFPVTIDPTLVLDLNPSAIDDTYVDSKSDNSFHDKDFIYVGKNSCGTTRAFIKFTLPALPDCSIVTGATLNLYQEQHDPGTGQIAYANLYDCGDVSWNSTNIRWSNQPDLSSAEVVDYERFLSNEEEDEYRLYTWDITKVAKRWYEEDVNNGVMLASADESITRRSRFLHSENYLGGGYPTIVISYVNNAGLEDYWSYESVDLGRSGTAYVNNYNGNFVYIHQDVSMNGNMMPVNISHVYNVESAHFKGNYASMKLGTGFRLNVQQELIAIASSDALYTNGYRYKHVDSDGTVHFYKTDPNDTSKPVAHEFNENLVITTSGTQRIITDEYGNKNKFASVNGKYYLCEIVDTNNNNIKITYNSNRITRVYNEDTGHGADFTYNANGFLTEISYKTGIDGCTAKDVLYEYSSNGLLEKITYPDGGVTELRYNTDGKLNLVVPYNRKPLAIEYKKHTNSNTQQYRVKKLTVKSVQKSDDTYDVENSLSFKYHTGSTVVTDEFGRSATYLFDSMGRTHSVCDALGNYSYANYNNGGNMNNTVSSDLYNIPSVNNFAKNHSAENSNSDGLWYEQDSNGIGSVAMTTEQHMVGSKSFKVVSSGTSGRVNYCQAFVGNPGTNYTVSAYVKLPQNITAGEGGAFVGFTYLDGGTWKTRMCDYVTLECDWTRIHATLELPETSTANVTNMGIMIGIIDASGTAYFDGVQLEKSKALNKYNLLENSSFNEASGKTTSNWTLQNCTSADGAYLNPRNNTNGIQLYGAHGAQKRVYQTVKVNAKAGDTIVYGAGASATVSGKCQQTIDGQPKRCFGISLTMHNADGTQSYHSVNFNNDISRWQYASSAYTFTKACTSVTLYLVYYYEVNVAKFDNAYLYLDNCGSSYTYDADGRLKTVKDGAGQGITYTYSGPDITKIQTTQDGVETDSVDYAYDPHTHNIKTATTKDGIVTAYEYNSQYSNVSHSFGNPSKIMVKNADGTLQSSQELYYTNYYCCLWKVTDARGKTTEYTYNADLQLTKVKDPDGNETEYTYNTNGDVTSVKGKKDASATTPTTVSYAYSKDNLQSVTHNGFAYNFGYDNMHRCTSVKVGTQSLISYTYNEDGTIDTATYGNGDVYTPNYDSYGRLTSETYDGTKAYAYRYNAEGLCARITDYESGNVKWYHTYDLAGRLSSLTGSNGISFGYTYDSKNNVQSAQMVRNGSVKSKATYTYDATSGLLTKVDLNTMSQGTFEYIYNDLNQRRFTRHTTIAGGPYKFVENYTYLEGVVRTDPTEDTPTTEGKTATTGLVTRVLHRGFNEDVSETYNDLRYTYTDGGNIATVTNVVTEKTNSYVYDKLNQLVRENNKDLNRTVVYTYDNGGNILSKTNYPYTTGALGTATSTINYVYDSVWKDKLIEYNGNEITYDAIGNPLHFRGRDFTWKKGRQLSTATYGDNEASYYYNWDGLRTKKVLNGKTTTYYYSGSMLMGQSNSDDKLYFLYSADGKLIGFNRNGLNYYYAYNVQGDVIALYNCYSQLNSRYVYDSWGRVREVLDANGDEITDTTHVAHVNPIRYRGYYYDNETGLYYLESRYYDPVTGRFISPDTTDVVTASPMALSDKNLYAYCDNNPIVRADSGGAFWHIAVGAAIGGLIGGISSVVGQAVSGQKINWAEVGVSAASGALTGAITAACPGMGAVATGIVHGVVGAGTHVATELVNGRTPTVAGTLASGVTSGVLAGGTKAVGNLVNKGLKIQKIGRLEASNHANDPQLGVKYQINKPNGRPTTRSIEFHYNHSHKSYKPHWQQNSWNPRNNSVSSMKHWTWWGKRI